MAYNRKPLERNKGRFKDRLPGLEEYAKKVANELVNMYPDVDIMDIERQFESSWRFAMAREMAVATIEEV